MFHQLISPQNTTPSHGLQTRQVAATNPHFLTKLWELDISEPEWSGLDSDLDGRETPHHIISLAVILKRNSEFDIAKSPLTQHLLTPFSPYREFLKNVFMELLKEANSAKIKYVRSQTWNIGIQVNLRSIKTKSAAILIGVVAISLMLFLAELWNTPLCGLPNPISDTPAAIMTLIGRITTHTMIWANRKRLRTAGWWGG